MENPRMAFLSPTVVKGDGTGLQVVAHELANSWTGNLITCKKYKHFWLNEGFTTYAERRIVEAVLGKERVALNIAICSRLLKEDMKRFEDKDKDCKKLQNYHQGADPSQLVTIVPYEKGFQLLWRIERQIGRPDFDEFLKNYIKKFKLKSIDTDDFLRFLKEKVPGIEDNTPINLKEWTEGDSLPHDAKTDLNEIIEPGSDTYSKIAKIVSLANEFIKAGKIPNEDEVLHWGGQEWELYITNLPKPAEASLVKTLNDHHRLSEHKNYEVKVAFLELAISSSCSNFYKEVEKTLKEVGRMKYLQPLYKALVEGTGKEKEIAETVFKEAKSYYHPIAQGLVEGILPKRTRAD